MKINNSSVLTIDCEEVENTYDVANGQMADLDWLLYNAPMEYASPAVRGDGELPEGACAPWDRRLNSLPVYRDARYTGFLLLLVQIIPSCNRRTGVPPSVIFSDGGMLFPRSNNSSTTQTY